MKIFHKEELIAVMPNNYNVQIPIDGRMLHIGIGYIGWYQPILPQDEIKIVMEE